MNEDFGDRILDMFCDIRSESSTQFSSTFETLCSDVETPLYLGCKDDYTRLTTVLKLMNLKARNGWTDASFTELLELLSDILPKGNSLPK